MQQIADWLEKLGMSEYAKRFADNDIDFAILPDLTDQDLEKIGVVSLGHRRKLLREIASLETCKTAAAAAAAPTGPSPRDTAERRQITVMFSDLVGSTALSTRMDAEDFREIISAYQKCVTENVRRFGGFVAKYMGDGVLVYFGYPQAHEDDAERAVRAGLELVAAVSGLKIGTALKTRVGIATGLVVVGDLIGSGAAQEQAVVGETPNLAARLQGIAEPNTVVIAETTRKLLGNLFEFEDLGAQDLKGIAGSVRAWAALRPSSVEGRFDALHASGLTQLIGREEELDLLVRRWSKARSGEGQVVLLSGEAGIGKSRLTAALMELLTAEPHTRLRYFCSPQHTDSALYPIIGQMERAAGFARDDTPQAKLDKLDAVLALSSTSTQDAALFAEMLSLTDDGRYSAPELTPEHRRQKTLEALTEQLEALSRQKPVLMIFEDAHWADPTSLEAFGRVVDRIKRLGALLIVTYRPEFEPPWIGRPHVTALILNRLGEGQIVAIIDSLTGNKLLLPSVRQDIIERTDGIPLFVEEMTKAVLEAGSEDAARQTAAGVPSPALAVPATLHASLMARLDRLGPAKEVAQIAAVLGREFSYEALASIAQKTDHDLQAALTRLGDAALVFCRGSPPQATYVYKHTLVRDAAYGSLLRSQRLQLHGRVVAALEKSVAVEPSLLARHCTEAGLWEKAVQYWLKAGQKALTRSAMAEAVAFLRKGLSLLSDMPNDEHRRRDELEFQIALGQAFQAVNGPASPETGEAYARARTLCELLNKPAQLPSVLFGIWIHHLMRGELEASRQDAIMWQRLGEDQKDLRLQVMGYRIRGQSEFLLGDFASARTNLEQGLALFNPADRPYYATLTPQDGRVLMLCFLGNALAAMGYVDQSTDSTEDAVADARRLGHSYTLAIALTFSLLQRAAHSPSEALRRSKELEVLSTQHGLGGFRGYAMVWRGSRLATLGHPQQGVEAIKQGIAATRASGGSSFIPHFITLLADAFGMAEQPAAGLEWLGEAISIVEATGERWYEAEIHRLRGDLLRAAGDGAAAEASFRDAIAVASKQQAKLFELRAGMSLARLWRDQGKAQHARELLAPVYGWFTEGFDTLDLKEAKALLDALAA